MRVVEAPMRTAVILCLAIGFVIAVIVARNRSNARYLFSIIDSGDHSALTAAVNAGNVNAADKWGWTPLMYAATRGHHDACTILLAAGADVAKRDTKGFSALDYVNGTLRRAPGPEYDRTAEYLKKQGLPAPAPSIGRVQADNLVKVKQLLDNALPMNHRD